MFLLASLAVLFAAALLCLSYSAYSRWTVFAAAGSALVFTVLTAAWIAADSFTGEGFNSAVLYHLRTGIDGAGTMEYLGLLIATCVLLGFALFLAAWLIKRLMPGAASKSGFYAMLTTGALMGLCLLHPTVNGFLTGFNLALYGPDSLLEAVLDRNRRPESGVRFSEFYTEPDPEWPDHPMLNVVVIYAESLERTYFDEQLFPGLINELRSLESEAVTFTDMHNVAGTGFTIAGMVASLCGLPLITNGHPNSMRGMDRFMSGAVCLGDLLSEQDYSLHYMGGARLSFAGKGKFFETHGFDSVMGLDELKPFLGDPEYSSSWGLYDDFLLDMFLQRFDELSAGANPFGLVGLTMDTHHPSGHLSRSCEDMTYGDGSNQMLNAVKCADRLLAETIRAIRQSEWADQTLLVVASDHLALKNDAYDILSQGQRRNLLWIFPPGEKPREITSPATSLDTPAIIAHYLGARVDGFGLGRNIAEGTAGIIQTLPRTNWQIREWRDEFANFWQLPGAIEQLNIDPKRMAIDVDGREFEAPALVSFDKNALESIRFEFDSKSNLYSYVRETDPGALLAWVDKCDRVRAMSLELPRHGLCLFAGKPAGANTIAVPLNEAYRIDAADLHRLSASPEADMLLTSRHASLDSLDRFGAVDVREFTFEIDALPAPGSLSVQSSGGPGTSSTITDSDQQSRLYRGLHLFSIEPGVQSELLASYDPCGGDAASHAPIAEVIARHDTEAIAFLLVAHDSATCGQSLDPLFAGSDLEDWHRLGLRQPYVALISKSEPAANIEVVGDAYTSLHIEFVAPAPEPGPGATAAPMDD